MNASEPVVLALDAHGGDRGLDVSVPAALAALEADSRLKLILVGKLEVLDSALSEIAPEVTTRLETCEAGSVIAMDAKPKEVLRRGKNSSMWNAFQLVAEGRADACVSGGSTTAMMVLGVKLIGTLPGIQRPALMAYVPNISGYTGLLDLGANLNVSARRLVQFAVMGSVTSRLVEGVADPRVGLLNVGHEDSKGHELVQQAHNLLRQLPLNYCGFIEGHDLFGDVVDVAVCDGFAGNLILKSSEGLAQMMLHQFRAALSGSAASRLGAVLAGRALRGSLARMDPAAHNGAPMLGLNGVAVKSHGSANCQAMTRAILEAGREARRQVPKKIEASIREYQLESSS